MTSKIWQASARIENKFFLLFLSVCLLAFSRALTVPLLIAIKNQISHLGAQVKSRTCATSTHDTFNKGRLIDLIVETI